MIVTCPTCSVEFKTYPCWVERGGGKFCSYSCMGESRKGKTNYVRTPEHKAKMSAIKKAEDNTAKRERFLKINAEKKGKTIEELYGDKASRLRELRRQQIGPNNPNWKGGKHRRGYPWAFFRLRDTILVRDGFICVNCNMTDTEAREKDSLGRGLTIHHIDYDKENNAPDNLVTLCKWCNSGANSKREIWQTHYRALLG